MVELQPEYSYAGLTRWGIAEDIRPGPGRKGTREYEFSTKIIKNKTKPVFSQTKVNKTVNIFSLDSLTNICNAYFIYSNCGHSKYIAGLGFFLPGSAQRLVLEHLERIVRWSEKKFFFEKLRC